MSRVKSRRLRQYFALGAAIVSLIIVAVMIIQTGVGKNPLDLIGPSVAPAHDKPISAHANVDGDQVLTDLTATELTEPSQVAGFSPESYEILTPIVKIGPSGKLPAPMKIKLKLKQRVTDPSGLMVITKSDGDAGWRPVEDVRLIDDGTRAEFQVDHLTSFQAIYWKINDILNGFSDFLGEATGLAGAKKPECKDEARAAREGYAIAVKTNAPNGLFKCLGYEKDVLRLELVNNRKYPVEVTLTGAELVKDDRLKLELAGLAEAGGKIILMPAEEGVFTIAKLDEGKSAKLEVSRSPFAQHLQQLGWSIAKTAELAGKVAEKRSNPYLLIPAVLNQSKECFNALAEEDLNAYKLDESCLHGALTEQFFGAEVSLLLKRLIARVAVADFVQGFLQSFNDKVSQSDRHLVTVSRLKGIPSKFIGAWWKTKSTLNVSRDGTAVAKVVQSDTCGTTYRVCVLRYTMKLTVADGDKLTGEVTRYWYTGGDTADSTTEIDVGFAVHEDSPQVGNTYATTVDSQGVLRQVPNATNPGYTLDVTTEWCNDSTTAAGRALCSG